MAGSAWIHARCSRRAASRRSHAARIAFLMVLLPSLAPPPALAAGDWPWPVDGDVVTSYRYGEDPYAAGQHRGIDIAADVGATVRSATAGTVRFAGIAGSSGLTVSIRTVDRRFDTSYLHLDSLAVRAGDTVEAGTELGAAGTTGSRSVEQSHLHFGVRDAGEEHAYRNPLRFLEEIGGPTTEPPASVPVAPRVRPLPPPRPAPAPVPIPRPAPVPRPELDVGKAAAGAGAAVALLGLTAGGRRLQRRTGRSRTAAGRERRAGPARVGSIAAWATTSRRRSTT